MKSYTLRPDTVYHTEFQSYSSLFQVEGPAARITGREASENRRRMTSKSSTGIETGVCRTDECHSCGDKATCQATPWCRWVSKNARCNGMPLGCVEEHLLYTLFSVATYIH